MHIPPAAQNYIEPDIQRALDWFLSFLPSDGWEKRKTAIESYLDSVLEPKKSRKDVKGLEPVSIKDDQIGWYLYLVETALTEMHRYEPIQGARVLPLFKRMGEDIDHLSRIGGIEDKRMAKFAEEYSVTEAVAATKVGSVLLNDKTL